MDEVRFALDAAVPVMDDRRCDFLAEWSAERSLWWSMVEELSSVSELLAEPASSDDIAGGLFSSSEERFADGMRVADGGDRWFEAWPTLRSLKGVVRSSLSEELARFRDRVGATGEPLPADEPRDLDRKPA